MCQTLIQLQSTVKKKSNNRYYSNFFNLVFPSLFTGDCPHQSYRCCSVFVPLSATVDYLQWWFSCGELFNRHYLSNLLQCTVATQSDSWHFNHMCYNLVGANICFQRFGCWLRSVLLLAIPIICRYTFYFEFLLLVPSFRRSLVSESLIVLFTINFEPISSFLKLDARARQHDMLWMSLILLIYQVVLPP